MRKYSDFFFIFERIQLGWKLNMQPCRIAKRNWPLSLINNIFFFLKGIQKEYACELYASSGQTFIQVDLHKLRDLKG